MEISQIQFVLSIATAVSYAGYSGFQVCKKYKKQNLFALLTSNTEGLSDILQEIEIDTSRIYPLVVDDEWIKSHSNKEQYEQLQQHKTKDALLYDMLLYRLVKNYIKEMKKSNPRVVFVVITSSHKLLQDLKIKSISLLLPSSKYHLKIIKNIDDDLIKESDQINRERYLNLVYPRFEFNNKQQLVDILERIFLKRRDELKNIAL